MRHGESEANILREFPNPGPKHGLTDKGRAQAAALAKKFSELTGARVLFSPLLSGADGGDHCAGFAGVPCEVVDALRAYDYGGREGRSDPTSWAEYDRVLREWVLHHRWESRVEGGESLLNIKQRFVPFVERVKAEHGDLLADLVLLGHGGLFLSMLPLVVENVGFDFARQHPLDQGGYAVAETMGEGLLCTGRGGVANGLALP